MSTHLQVARDHHRGRLAVLLLVSALVASCGGDFDVDTTEGRTQEIVGGANENGYPGVVALSVAYSDGLGGLCSGALIDDQWVLTAAHCFFSDTGADVFTVHAYNGRNVNTASPSEFIIADSFVTNPDYDDRSGFGDVALVHLASTFASYEVYPLRTASLSGGAGTDIFWVGYGNSDGFADTGSGRKRSGSARINRVFLTQYEYVNEGTMTCSGDSGGPAFITRSGTQEIAGVVNSGDENCDVVGYDLRVDAWASWIQGVLSGTPPGPCDLLGGDCGSQVCALFDGGNVCVPSGGIAPGGACNSDSSTWVASWPCADGAICVQVSADPTDGQCFGFCYVDGDCPTDQSCVLDVFVDDPTLGICADGVMACEINAHECPSGEACFPTSGGGNGCFPSDEIAIGAACNADQDTWDTLPCDDGLICIQVSSDPTDGICMAMCLVDGDCAADEVCDAPLFTGIDDIGLCGCLDADNDGYCVDVDCVDTNPNVYPGRPEICSDLLDNDCNGTVNDGCSVCTDADMDGFCLEDDDCDDSDGTVNPGATETCDDGVDNDCDRRVDEGCAVCTDVDGDGYCAETSDCDDSRANVYPGARERCGNMRDDDCDGIVNEGCEVCTDVDMDGFCAEIDDCDDNDPTRNRTATEACGDFIDNDCDSFIDEGCGCTDGDGDGFCTTDGDCDDTNGDIYPGAAEVCSDGIDQDCDGADDDCPVCTDADGDGVCVEEGDCDDSNADTNPNEDEACGDGADNDCDGEIDEDCPTCIDADGDGYCREADCDDLDATASPDADKLCGDLFDNDCDGDIDEGCDCTDEDGDGYCAEDDDCDDTNARVNPTASEVCEDGVDNDCDGDIDEACGPCIDEDLDGYCISDGDCDDSDPLSNPGGRERCDGADNDCNGEIDDGLMCEDPEADAGPDVVEEDTGVDDIDAGGGGTVDDVGTGNDAPGGNDNGCSTTGSRRPALWPLVALIGLVLRRRR